MGCRADNRGGLDTVDYKQLQMRIAGRGPFCDYRVFA
jgi:hypothetical protein